MCTNTFIRVLLGGRDVLDVCRGNSCRDSMEAAAVPLPPPAPHQFIHLLISYRVTPCTFQLFVVIFKCYRRTNGQRVKQKISLNQSEYKQTNKKPLAKIKPDLVGVLCFYCYFVFVVVFFSSVTLVQLRT